MTREEQIEWASKMRGEDVPGDWIEVAKRGYSMHGEGLIANILAAVAPLIREQAAAAERDRILSGAGELKVTLTRPANGNCAEGVDMVRFSALEDLIRGGE